MTNVPPKIASAALDIVQNTLDLTTALRWYVEHWGLMAYAPTEVKRKMSLVRASVAKLEAETDQWITDQGKKVKAATEDDNE
jgi:hypothetical protein